MACRPFVVNICSTGTQKRSSLFSDVQLKPLNILPMLHLNNFYFLKWCSCPVASIASHLRKISAANETCCCVITVISYDRGWSKNGLHQFAPFSQLLTIPAGFVCQRLDKNKTNCLFATSLGVARNTCGFLIHRRKRRGEGNSFVPLSPPCLPSLNRVSIIPSKESPTDIDEGSAAHCGDK